MMLNTCKQVEEYLVDYTDNHLDSDSRDRVAEHLRQCHACQRRADALTRSLALTQVIWQDSLEQTQKYPVKERPVTRRLQAQGLKLWVLKGTAAAAIVLLTSLLVFRNMPSHPTPSQLTFEDIEFQLETEASAARLLVAAELLARKPHAKALAQRQYQYILDHYPATRAGIQTRAYSK
jgi:anti-sigma factor RsiW